MDSNLELEKLNYISEQLVLFVYKKIEYDEIKKQCAACKSKLNEISKKIESLNNIEYPSNITFNISGFELKSNRALQFQILKEQEQSLNKELAIHLNHLCDLHNMYMQHLTNFRSYSLESNELIDYFDISVQLNEKFEFIKYILTNSYDDLNRLYTYGIKLPSTQQYKGKITIIEMIIAQGEICKSKTSECYELRQKILAIQENINEFEINRDKALKKISRFDLNILRKILNKKEYEYLKEYVYGINIEINYFRKDKYLMNEKLKELEQEKQNECYKVIKICENIDELIDALGEKSLQELITKLNIVIPKSDDNYFNEKEVMKKLIKKYFEEFQEKINNEINKEKELEENNNWSKIDVMNIISDMQKDEKVLIKK